MSFEPNYKNILDVAQNRKPERLPLYEHIISRNIMGKIMNADFTALEYGNESDLKEFSHIIANFLKI